MTLAALKQQYKNEYLLPADVLLEFPDLVRLGYTEQCLGRLVNMFILSAKRKTEKGYKRVYISRLSVLRLVQHINDEREEEKIKKFNIVEG